METRGRENNERDGDKIFRSLAGPDNLFAVFEDDGETGYLYLYQQGAPAGNGILGAVHVYDKEQCPDVREDDIKLGWTPDFKACQVRVGTVEASLNRPASA